MKSLHPELFSLLDELGIETKSHQHPAVFTVEEAQKHTAHLTGGHCKNLFLKDKKGGFWLIVCLDEQSIRMNHIRRLIGAPPLSFAKPDALMTRLGVEPGSVTPFALIKDKERVVRLVLDEKMMAFDTLNYHPLRNDATTSISSGDLMRFFKHLGHSPLIVDLDPPADAA